MHYATLKAEFITPCFCGGADQSKPELRIQSIRGQLRWWYRICGATQEEEAELFGSTDKVSPLTVRITKVDRRPASFYWKENEKLSTYLWYFLKEQKRKCLPIDTSFDLILKSREKDILEKGIAVAALWINLGALGSRSTRAAGCMRLDQKNYNKADCPQTKKLAEAIYEANEPVSLWNTIKSYLPCKKEEKPFELYRCPKETSSGLDAAKWLAEKWWEVRRYKFKPPHKNWIIYNGIGREDHDDAIAAMNNRLNDDLRVRRVVLGMPYTQNFCDTTLEWKYADGEKFERMASPVHLRPIYKNGKVYPALLIFTDRLSHCPNHVYAQKAGKIKVDQKTAIDKVRLICNIREI
ncbi:MAG: hypothetical protein AVO38_05640 [delta proteobacterium ML8_D]|nr:MAG: hypothetical protein AVO38_05640 [delta proteobacterium ML8_D]